MRFDVLGIGNAIVDVLSFTEESFLQKHGVQKGVMTLIDEERAEFLYGKMGPATECSGGSAANTMVGIASLGGRAAYIGRVKDDALGKIFAHDIKASGVHFESAPAKEGKATARCFILVTPDAQRTMNTYLGACTELDSSYIDEALIADAALVYVEGYLWDQPEAKKAIKQAVSAARRMGKKVAFTLSDPFCVERHRAEFKNLVQNHVDIVFANEHEAVSLFETSGLQTALEEFRAYAEISVITRSGDGSVIVSGNDIIEISAMPAPSLVDTTGAGDLYASGFLYGLAKGLPLAECGRIASAAASEIIQQLGARPEKKLSRLVA